MKSVLAQAIQLPGTEGRSMPVEYPEQFNGFLFKGADSSVGSILNNAMPLILGIAGLGLLLMFILAGYTFLTSVGDAKKLEKGKQQLTNAIVGFIIIFGAYWIVQLIGIMFGSEITSGFN